MTPRALAAPVVAAALVLVATVGGPSPAARHDLDVRSTDLLSSAHPTTAQPAVRDTAYDAGWVRSFSVQADAAALSSATCDACVAESTTLQVVYGARSRRVRLDNAANAWAQECRACTSTALSVQVVVLQGRPVAVANNRALSVNAACDGCRTAALAFQVVLVSDSATPMSGDELAQLRAWVDEQAAQLRASVSAPPTEPEPTPEPTPTPTPTPTATPTPTQSPTRMPSVTTTHDPRPGVPHLMARRDAVSALGDLEALLASALQADTVSADVDLGR